MDTTIRVSPRSKRAIVVRLLAERLGVAKSAVTITCGLASIHKTVRVEGYGRGGGGQAAWRRRLLRFSPVIPAKVGIQKAENTVETPASAI